MPVWKEPVTEMLYLDDTQIEKATPEMTAKEIRQLKEPEIPGQMEIQDYPEVLPEGKYRISPLMENHTDGHGAKQSKHIWKMDMKGRKVERK